MTTTPAKRPSTDQIERELAMHIGSEERIRHWTRQFLYTPGVQHLAQRAAAYWLIDLIASHCRNPQLVGEGFQLWKLQVRADRTATLSVEDGNERELLTCSIHATDFPLAEITLYLTEGVLLLPGEY